MKVSERMALIYNDPPKVAKRKSGPNIQLEVMALLALIGWRCSSDNNRYFTTQAKLASQLGVSDRTVRRLMPAVLATGYVTAVRESRGFAFTLTGQQSSTHDRTTTALRSDNYALAADPTPLTTLNNSPTTGGRSFGNGVAQPGVTVMDEKVGASIGRPTANGSPDWSMFNSHVVKQLGDDELEQLTFDSKLASDRNERSAGPAFWILSKELDRRRGAEAE